MQIEMEINGNPILEPKVDPAFNWDDIDAPVEHKRKVKAKRRELKDLRRVETAREAIRGWDKSIELFALTRGQYSLVQLIEAVIELIGPVDAMFISTWTAAHVDVGKILEFVKSGLVKDARWLVDFSFSRRSPALVHEIRNTFGPNAIRVSKNHSKYVTLRNADHKVVIRCSMNINANMRNEHFSLEHSEELYNFLEEINNAIWNKQKKELADGKAGDFERYYRDEM